VVVEGYGNGAAIGAAVVVEGYGGPWRPHLPRFGHSKYDKYSFVPCIATSEASTGRRGG